MFALRTTIVCEQCDTPLLDVALEDKIKINNVHLTRFEGQVPPQKERLVDIEIYPLKFLTSNSGLLSIHFQDLTQVEPLSDKKEPFKWLFE